MRLQVAGRTDAADPLVVVGSLSERSFLCFFLADRRPVAAFAMNRPRDKLAARKLVEAGHHTEPEHLADEQRPLAQVA